MADRARPDQNINYSLLALSNADGLTPVTVWADPTTHGLILSGGGGDGAILDGVSSSIKATVASLTNSRALAVEIVDGSGTQITSFGGGTQYAELATTSPGTGTLSLARYKSTPPSLTDGQLYGLQLDTSGNLKVTGSLSVGGTTDNSAFTAGTSTGTPAMGFYHSTIDAVTDGRAAAVGITSKRAMLVTLQTSAGADTGVAASPMQVSLANTATNATAVKVDGSAVTQPVSGTVAIGAGSAVIGHVITDTGSTTAVTGTVTISGAVTEATLDAALISQEATTSGVKGLTVFGAVTTAKPSYTTAKSDALSLDVNGLLRVSLADTPANAVKLLVTPDSVALPSNQSVNVSQINGVTPLMGTGIMGTGSLRVTIASDNDPLTVKQATAASLNATVVGTGTFVVQATLAAETTKVIGTARILGNAGATLDGVIGAATAPANMLVAGGVYNSTELGPTTGQSTALQLDAKGRLRNVIMDAAGNTRGANVDANNNLGVVLAAETTKVLGVTRTSDGAGNLLTSNSTTYSAKFGLDANLLGTLGTAFTTPGKIDVIGSVTANAGTNLNTSLLALEAGGNLDDIDAGIDIMKLSVGATGAAVPANGVYNGGNAQTALPTAASAGNLTGATYDKFGRSVVLANAMRDIMGTQTTTIAASTTETTIITAVASTFLDLISVFISNTSATAARVDVRDTTAGSIIFQFYIPAGDMRGVSLTTPWPQTSVNTNWTAQSSASITDLRISALFIKNK